MKTTVPLCLIGFTKEEEEFLDASLANAIFPGQSQAEGWKAVAGFIKGSNLVNLVFTCSNGVVLTKVDLSLGIHPSQIVVWSKP